MKTTFNIRLNVKTADGPESYGCFSIGNDRDAALHLFHSLKGCAAVDEAHFLTMELMETVDGLPFNLQLISCTLDDLAYNCRIIGKEIFQLANLKS